MAVAQPTLSSHTAVEPKPAYATGSFEADLAKALKASLPPPVPPKPKPLATSASVSQVAQVKQMKVEAPKLPAIAFGKEKWARYFGDVGIEPPLPADIDKILNSECPFWKGKRIEETHLLVLIPATIDGKPFCLDLLSELIQEPKTGHATKYNFYLGKAKAEHGQKAPSKSYWALMTGDVLEGTRQKSYQDQCAVLNKQRKERPYEPPGLLEAATAILMEHVKTGQRLFTREPLTYTRCREQVEGWQTAVVGGFGASGLDIGLICVSISIALNNGFDGHDGLAAVWKL